MKRVIYVVATLIALISSQAVAQAGLERASTNPITKQFVVEFTDGGMVVADDTTQKFLVVTKSGQHFEVSFSDALASVESDPLKRQQLLLDFRASLNDQTHLVTIAKPRLAVDDSVWPLPSMCGDVACIDPYGDDTSTSAPDFSAKNAAGCKNHYLCPRNLAPCDLGPCSPARWGDNFMFYSGFRAGWGDDQGGGNLTEQDLVAYDQQRWQNMRDQACHNTNLLAATSVAAAGVMVGSCALSGTGVGAVVCVGSVILYGISVYQTYESRDQCLADYPGLGNW